MGAMASKITSLTIVNSTVYLGADQIKYQSYASLAFVRGIHPAQKASNAKNVSIWWRHLNRWNIFFIARVDTYACGLEDMHAHIY